MIHPKISSLVSLTQQNSAFSDDFREERQMITESTRDAVDRLKSFWAQGLPHVSVHAFVVTLDLPTEFQLVSICKIQNQSF